MIAATCLAMAIYYEARSEPIDGQRAVADVIMARKHHVSYPDTVCAVVAEDRGDKAYDCQFSFMCDGLLETYPDTDAWIQSNQIASLVLSPALPDLVGGATHYHADYVNPYWSKSLDSIATIGSHKFYR